MCFDFYIFARRRRELTTTSPPSLHPPRPVPPPTRTPRTRARAHPLFSSFSPPSPPFSRALRLLLPSPRARDTPRTRRTRRRPPNTARTPTARIPARCTARTNRTCEVIPTRGAIDGGVGDAHGALEVVLARERDRSTSRAMIHRRRRVGVVGVVSRASTRRRRRRVLTRARRRVLTRARVGVGGGARRRHHPPTSDGRRRPSWRTRDDARSTRWRARCDATSSRRSSRASRRRCAAREGEERGRAAAVGANGGTWDAGRRRARSRRAVRRRGRR